MKRKFKLILVLGLTLIGGRFVSAEEPRAGSKPEPIPLTRDDMKRALDASKQSVPRLPLPPETDEEKALIEEQKAEATKKGEAPRRLGLANNGRMRAFYLGEYGYVQSNDVKRARTGSYPDSDSGFDRSFRTMMFWIISRGNNCTYCLGHQESSLASVGMSDDQLAALDSDWSQFDEAKQAAFAFAVKLSFEPWAIDDQDFAALRKHYNEQQVTEMVSVIGGFNATNRWTGPLRIKQDVSFVFVRPTSPKYSSVVSLVAPADLTAKDKGFAAPNSRRRPPLESQAEVETALAAARTRTPRLKLAMEAEAKAVLKEGSEDLARMQWVRLLATLPKSGADRIATYKAVLEKGTVEPRTKAIIAYVGARHDRAWYALGHAIQRLKSNGVTDAQIVALDQPEKLASAVDREVIQFARKITVDPALIDNDDFARMRKLFDDKQVAEVVYLTTQAAFFDRLTEAAALRLEN